MASARRPSARLAAYARFSFSPTGIFLIADKRDFAQINPHMGDQPT